MCLLSRLKQSVKRRLQGRFVTDSALGTNAQMTPTVVSKASYIGQASQKATRSVVSAAHCLPRIGCHTSHRLPSLLLHASLISSLVLSDCPFPGTTDFSTGFLTISFPTFVPKIHQFHIGVPIAWSSWGVIRVLIPWSNRHMTF